MVDATTGRAQTLRIVIPGTAMIAVTFGLARYGYGLLLPDMRADLHLTTGTAGLISSAAYLSYLVANAGSVAIAGRRGPRTAIALAAGLAAVGMFAIAVASGAWSLGLGVVLAGAAAGLAFPPYADIAARGIPDKRRDRAWSTISSGTGWGVALAGPIAVVAGDRWRIAWAVFVVLAVGVGIAATIAAPKHPGRVERPARLDRSWFLCPRSRPLLISAILIGTGSSVWWSFAVDALQTASVAPSSARIVYAVGGAASLLASFSGTLFARIGLRTGYLVTGVVLAASLVAFGLGDGLLAVVPAAAFFGTTYAAVIAGQGIWSSRVFADHPAAGLAAINTALTVGTLAGPTLAGFVIEQTGYPPALAGAGVAVLAAMFFVPPRSGPTGQCPWREASGSEICRRCHA